MTVLLERISLSSSSNAVVQIDLTPPDTFFANLETRELNLDEVFLHPYFATFKSSSRLLLCYLLAQIRRQSSMKVALNVTVIGGVLGLRRGYITDALAELEAAGLIAKPPETRGKSRHDAPRARASARSPSPSSLIQEEDTKPAEPKVVPRGTFSFTLEDHPAYLNEIRMKFSDKEPGFIEFLKELNLLSLRPFIPRIMALYEGDLEQFKAFCAQLAEQPAFKQIDTMNRRYAYLANSIKSSVGLFGDPAKPRREA